MNLLPIKQDTRYISTSRGRVGSPPPANGPEAIE